jgi:16S rRNA (uracil1498-N3)-methyltransferase
MMHRFYVPGPLQGPNATLHGPEAHHLQHVLRARSGDEIVLFDGTGWEFRAQVGDQRRGEVEVAILESRQVSREAEREIVMGVTLPKGERQRWLVEKLVELGTARLIPLRSRRSVVTAKPGTLEKLRRAVIEASKQCGRNQLMRIDPPEQFEQFLDSAPSHAARWIADPGGEQAGRGLGHATAEPIWLAVGPEGGFTPDECATARQLGWQLLSLGPRILRIDTAALTSGTDS